MGKLITVVGNSGVGKTTLTNILCEAGSFVPILEVPEERPFTKRFQDDPKGFSLANQVDYLLFQAEQEIFVRENDIVGVQDGGLEQSFHLFTKRFHQKGHLNDEEFYLCERLYSTLRKLLPFPDLVIKLNAPCAVLAKRMATRQREIDIEKSKDLAELEALIEEWMKKGIPVPTIEINASEDDPCYENIIDDLVRDVKTRLKI